MGLEPTRTGLAGDQITEAIVVVEQAVRLGEISRVVLSLPIGTQDLLEATDRNLVLAGHRARRLEGRASREHHRRAGGHDEYPGCVHEHRRQCVEVALCAYVRSLDDQVDHPARLREVNDSPDDTRSRV